MSRACVLVMVLTAGCPGAAAVPAAEPAPRGPPASLYGKIIVKNAVSCGDAAFRPGRSSSFRSPGGGPLHLRPGNENTQVEPVAQITTDYRGAFAIDLPAGTYCLVVSAKLDLAPPGQVPMYTDPACLDSWRKTCDAVFEVPSAEPVSVWLCQPSLHPCYHGPLPP